ncbi:MAG: helix-turn-helix transcriptional regulator [Bermanella sp.]
MSSKKQSKIESDQVNLPFTDLNRFELRAGQSHIRHDNAQVEGFEIMYQLQPGIMLRILDFTRHNSRDIEIATPPGHLIFSFNILGNETLEVENHGSISLTEGCMLAAYSHLKRRMALHPEKSEKRLFVMLLCEPEILLKPPFDMEAEQLPDCIQTVVNGAQEMAESVSMSMELIQALRIFLHFDTLKPWSRPFIQAKSIEILCLALSNISHQESQKKLAHVSEKEREHIQKASLLLLNKWRNPPSQEELVQTLGVGKSTLKRVFKLINGCSITDFVLNIRMQNAQLLLSEGKLNVTQIAMEVGYEHSSNFASAFKRHFGISPKAFQKATTGKFLEIE